MKKLIKMQTPQQLTELLADLVSIESISLSEQEKLFPFRLKDILLSTNYFQEHPELVEIHSTDDNRSYLTALYRHQKATKTIVLISHFDVVNVEEYGDIRHLAFSVHELTKAITEQKESFSEEVRRDIKSGDYLFGRGILDMKCGLVLHLSLLEKAALEKWPINLLLLTVPDEEVCSVGMRTAVTKLLEISHTYKLNYSLFLNSEPVFSQKPGDESFYAYTGSIGKIMPAALFYGQETHVGEPLSGVNAAWMASILTKNIEWNMKFSEVVQGERTPLPSTLYLKDLKQNYSAQTPHRAAAFYNVFLMERSAKEVIDLYLELARESVQEMNDQLTGVLEREGLTKQKIDIKVLTYEELANYAINKYGQSYVDHIITEINEPEKLDDREMSIHIVDLFSIYCQELAPMVIIFFTPPYYPAVHSGHEKEISELIDKLRSFAREQFSLVIKPVSFFNGISDLSYVSYKGSMTGWESFEKNTPVWGERYFIPFTEMEQLAAPVLNVGPFGKDAHKKTERLNIQNAFEVLPSLLEHLVKTHMDSPPKKAMR
ncbi:M20/M25/M40 family metallo-hydrolase [Bacillaceae bacterium IKA-2]|nr:M20/M25/M40 family metallo-hydrolase [Bacillaceae bacterium IKA-2]